MTDDDLASALARDEARMRAVEAKLDARTYDEHPEPGIQTVVREAAARFDARPIERASIESRAELRGGLVGPMPIDPVEEIARRRFEEQLSTENGVFAIDQPGPVRAATTILERYSCTIVHIPGGTVEIGMQSARGEPIRLIRNEVKRLVSLQALELNGDSVDDDSAPGLQERIVDAFTQTWPARAWWIEIWQAEERLTQVYHRWPWPGDGR